MLAAAASALFPCSASAEEVKKGDVNNDGRLTAGDISSIAAHIKGLKTLEYRDDADINGDGRVNASDITSLAFTIRGFSYDSYKPTSTGQSPSYLVLKDDWNGLVHTRELDPDSEHGVMFDNLYYGYQIDPDTYRIFCKNSEYDVPADHIEDGAFISNEYNSILKMGVISQFDNELNSSKENGIKQNLCCGPACISMMVSSELDMKTSVTQVIKDGTEHAKDKGTEAKELYSEGCEWCKHNGTTVDGMKELMQIYASQNGLGVSAPGISYGEDSNSVIDKIDAALNEGHTVAAVVLFNSRYQDNENDLRNIHDGPNYNPTEVIYTHYVVIAGECDGSGKYDGYYAVADPYKRVLTDETGMTVDDTNTGLTIVRKQDIARSISWIYSPEYRGLLYFD